MKIDRNSLNDNRLYFSSFVKVVPLCHSPFVKGGVRGILIKMSCHCERSVAISVSITLCIVLLLSCSKTYIIPSYAQVSDADLHPMIISDRVGENIDFLERKNYNLFPKVQDFESAVIYQIGKDDPEYKSGYVVEITKTDGRKYRSVNRDFNGIKILRDYINNYDSIAIINAGTMILKRKEVLYIEKEVGSSNKINDPFENHWQIVDYDDIGLAITKNEVMKYNKHIRALLYGPCFGLSTCIIGLGMSLLFPIPEPSMGVSIDIDGEIDGTELLITGVSAVGIFAVGAYSGDRKDKDIIIKAIKEGRKLKIIDRYNEQ